MKLYFAPLEGIGTYTYRNLHQEMFGGCDAYFAPFLVPTENERISTKTLRDILPQNTQVPLRVQCLSENVTCFLEFADKVAELGYDEINLNLGCPSGTVVKKRRGAGALRDPDRLNFFLEGVYARCPLNISIKTRIGFSSPDEWEHLLRIFNQYPVSELIIHPRVREDFYQNAVNREAFDLAYQESKANLCYNGDIFTMEDFKEIVARYPRLHGVMLGRGVIKNPAIFREIRGGAPLTTEELLAFSSELERRYLDVLGSPVYTLHKLKEIWLHMMDQYPLEKKILKAVKKSNRLEELHLAISGLPPRKRMEK